MDSGTSGTVALASSTVPLAWEQVARPLWAEVLMRKLATHGVCKSVSHHTIVPTAQEEADSFLDAMVTPPMA